MTPIVPSLSNMSVVYDQVRSNALQSFSYCANTVLALGIEENLCDYAQDIIEDEESYFIPTKRPRALAVSLIVWLQARGVTVLSDVMLPKHEIVEWLELMQGETTGRGCTVELRGDGVQVTWL